MQDNIINWYSIKVLITIGPQLLPHFLQLPPKLGYSLLRQKIPLNSIVTIGRGIISLDAHWLVVVVAAAAALA